MGETLAAYDSTNPPTHGDIRTFYSDFNTVFVVPLLLLAAGVGFLLLVFEDEKLLFAEIQPIQDSPSQG